jgi:hypothetical protein
MPHPLGDDSTLTQRRMMPHHVGMPNTGLPLRSTQLSLRGERVLEDVSRSCNHQIYHTKDNKIWDNFQKLFGIVNTTLVIRLETELSNLKMGDFDNVEEYIPNFENLKADSITSNSKAKLDPKHTSTSLKNISPASKSFVIIFYFIPLFVKGYDTPYLEDIFLLF